LNKLSHIFAYYVKGGIVMVGFGDKFKSIVNQAQQKVTDIQNSEQMKGIVGQIKEKVTEYSDIAQTKLEEYEQYVVKSEKQRIESSDLAQIKAEEDQNNSEKQGLESAALAQIKTEEYRRNSEQMKAIVGQIKEKFTEYSDIVQKKLEENRAKSEKQIIESAAADASNYRYQKAINTLKAIPTSSELYEDAQKKISEYVNASYEYLLQQAAQMTNKGLYHQAINTLKAIPNSSELYEDAQKKIYEYILEKSEKRAEQGFYDKAINNLKKIPSSSDLYEEAQQRISEYLNASYEYILQQSVQMVDQGLYNEAIKSLEEAIESLGKSPEEAALYQQAQKKICEYVNTFETLIKKHKNLIPILNNERIVAAAFVDQTVHYVKEIECTPFIYNYLGNTDADGEFLIIRLIVRNEGKKARTISASMMTIIDSKEREYSVSSKGQTALTMNGDQTVEFLVSEIQPGLQKIITIIFDLVPGVNNLSLKIPGSWGGVTILPLSLAI
jgi:tetratricopeptide (TPR) repeat protein